MCKVDNNHCPVCKKHTDNCKCPWCDDCGGTVCECGRVPTPLTEQQYEMGNRQTSIYEFECPGCNFSAGYDSDHGGPMLTQADHGKGKRIDHEVVKLKTGCELWVYYCPDCDIPLLVQGEHYYQHIG